MEQVRKVHIHLPCRLMDLIINGDVVDKHLFDSGCGFAEVLLNGREMTMCSEYVFTDDSPDVQDLIRQECVKRMQHQETKNFHDFCC